MDNKEYGIPMMDFLGVTGDAPRVSVVQLFFTLFLFFDRKIYLSYFLLMMSNV